MYEMTWKVIPILSIGFLNGCAQTTSGDYCDIASPLYFENQDVVEYLSQKDATLLREIVIANETWAELCAGKTFP